MIDGFTTYHDIWMLHIPPNLHGKIGGICGSCALAWGYPKLAGWVSKGKSPFQMDGFCGVAPFMTPPSLPRSEVEAEIVPWPPLAQHKAQPPYVCARVSTADLPRSSHEPWPQRPAPKGPRAEQNWESQALYLWENLERDKIYELRGFGLFLDSSFFQNWETT